MANISQPTETDILQKNKTCKVFVQKDEKCLKV